MPLTSADDVVRRTRVGRIAGKRNVARPVASAIGSQIGTYGAKVDAIGLAPTAQAMSFLVRVLSDGTK